MEQSESVQGLTLGQPKMTQSVMGFEAIQKAPDPEPTIEWHEESVDIEFRDGMYFCKDLEGGYLTRDSLKKAWRIKISKEKIAKADEVIAKMATSGRSNQAERGKARDKAFKEKKKWSNP